jgi:hypothetical protein
VSVHRTAGGRCYLHGRPSAQELGVGIGGPNATATATLRRPAAGGGGEVREGGPDLGAVLPGERHPELGELGGLAQRVACHRRAAVVGDVARQLARGVVQRQQRQHRVHRHHGRLQLRVRRRHEHVHRRQQLIVARPDDKTNSSSLLLNARNTLTRQPKRNKELLVATSTYVLMVYSTVHCTYCHHVPAPLTNIRRGVQGA